MKQYVVDAFTDQIFCGNPAAVCIMEDWLSCEVMQAMAVENNLSETAFAVKEGERYHLRWFTPGGEIDLCGHATLATAFVIMNYYEREAQTVGFSTMSGSLSVKKTGELYEMDFPAYGMKQVPVTDEMEDAIGVRPLEAWMARDLVCVLPGAQEVLEHTPDMAKVKGLPGLLLHTTAEGENYDCVTRSYAPKLGIPEDPVCGSGHCHVIPYWANRLGKTKIVACQASRRGGVLYGQVMGERISLGGKAALYSKAEVFIG